MNAPVVTLVNPNKVHPPITPYALDILASSLGANGLPVEVVDLTLHRDRWREVIRDYFASRTPLLVGVTIRNTDTLYAQDQRVFLGEHAEIISEIRAHTTTPVVVGGVGYSTMPAAGLDYFGVEYGIKGPGEITLVRLAGALRDGRPPAEVPGLLINRGNGDVHPTPPVSTGSGSSLSIGRRPEVVDTALRYRRRSGSPWRVDNLAYYRRGGLGNILTKNGCPMACTHCVEPDAKGTTLTRRSVAAVVDEMEELVGQGIHDLHTTDSEFNVGLANSKAVLKEIVSRKDRDATSPLHDLRLWIYTQPRPFDEELMDLLVTAGCGGINLGTDHTHTEMLDGWKITARGATFYDLDHTERVCRWATERNIPVMVEALFGMPGETAETITDCVRRTLDLNVRVVGYSLGIRVFPYSPFGIELAAACDGVRTVPGLQSNTATRPIVLEPLAKCSGPVEYERQFMWDEEGRFRPVFYFSPDLPEDPDTITAPNGRWVNTLRLLWDLVPPGDHHRVMLPTLTGVTPGENNYADNPFLLALNELGYTGAFWSRWPEREEIMRQAEGHREHSTVTS